MELSPFKCAECGNCCRGEGFVAVTPRDIARIAAFLDIPDAKFVVDYTQEPDPAAREANGTLWLVDHPGEAQECVFLEDNRCRIHAVKPRQCRGFPNRWRTPGYEVFCEGMRR